MGFLKGSVLDFCHKYTYMYTGTGVRREVKLLTGTVIGLLRGYQYMGQRVRHA